MDANLEWWANSSFMLGLFPVVVEDVRAGRLRDVAHLEDSRQTHDLDPVFTLRFVDDDAIEVIVGRPDDDGRFALSAGALEYAVDVGLGLPRRETRPC